MACKLNIVKDSKYIIATDQLGELKTLRLAMNNNGKIPTVNTVIGEKVGSVISESALAQSLDRLASFNAKNNSSFGIAYTKTDAGVEITGHNNNYIETLNTKLSNKLLDDNSIGRNEALNDIRNQSLITSLDLATTVSAADYMFSKTSEDLESYMSQDMTQPQMDQINREREANGMHALQKFDVSAPDFEVMSDLSFESRVKHARDVLGVQVVLTDENVYGRLSFKDGKPIAYVNRERAKEDTIFHELVGHLYVESVGGLSNNRVRAIADRIAGTDRFNEIRDAYPELDAEGLMLEAVADAIGREANDVFETQQDQNMFERFMQYILDAASKAFNLNLSDASLFARQGLETNMANATGEGNRYQKIEFNEMVSMLKGSKDPNSEHFIDFDVDEHKYSKDGVTATQSVTQIAGENSTFVAFEKKLTIKDVERGKLPQAFIMAMKLENLSIKNLKDKPENIELINLVAQAITNKWDATREWGTDVHNILDAIISGGTTEGYDSKYKAVVKEAIRLRGLASDPNIEIVTEARLFDKVTSIAGSVDVMIFNKANKTIEIIDFKTKALKPDGKFSVIHASILKQYAMQTSLYGGITEKQFGYKTTKKSVQVFGLNFNDKGTELLSDIVKGDKIKLDNTDEYKNIQNRAEIKVGLRAKSLLDNEDISAKARDRILSNLRARVYTPSLGSSEVKQKELKEFEREMKLALEIDEVAGMKLYMYNQVDKLQSIVQQLEFAGADLTVEQLHELKFNSGGLLVLDDLRTYYLENKKEFDAIDDNLFMNMEQVLATLAENKQFIFDAIKNNSVNVVAERLSSLSNLQSVERKDKLTLEFQKNNPQTSLNSYELDGEKVDQETWEEAKESYIYENLKKTETIQQSESFDMWKQYITDGYFDINMLDLLFVDAANSKSILIQTVNKLFSNVEYDTRVDVSAKRDEFDNFVKDYSDKHDLSINDIHEILTDKDSKGKPTGFMKGKYDQKIYDTINDYNEKMDALFKEGLEDGAEYKKAYAARTKYWYEVTANKEGDLKDRYITKEYKDHPELLDKYTEMLEEADVKLRGAMPLARKVYGIKHKFFQIPVARASTVEQARAHGIIPALKDHIKGMFSHQAADLSPEGIAAAQAALKDGKDNGDIKVKTSLNGSEYQSIPVYYRGQIEISEMSFDISTLVLENYNMASNFQHKSNIQPTLELLMELVQNTRPYSTFGLADHFKIDINSALGKRVRQTGESNESKKLASIIEDRLYGVGIKPNSWSKGIATISKWSADTMLILNILAGTNNVINGQVANFIESTGNPHLSPKSMAKAIGIYTKDLNVILKDIGQTIPKAKINVLAQLLDIQGEFATVGTDYFKDNIMMKTFANNNSHFISAIGENYLQSTLMISLLSGIKIMNADGKYLDAKGKVVKSKDKAASLYDVTTTKDGKIKTSVDFYSTSRNPTKPHDWAEVSLYIKDVAADLHGQYDEKMKAHAQRFAVGRAAFSLRKWILRLYQQKFKGASSVLTDWNDLDVHHKSYSEAQLSFKEGRYVSAGRFMIGLGRDVFKLRRLMVSENWNRLNDTQKHNVIKTMYEAGMALAAFLAAGVLYGMHEEDPDDEALLFMAYQARRLYSEMSMFGNPNEAMRILKSPAVSMNQVQTLFTIAGTVVSGSAGEKYVRGNRKDEYKIQKQIERLFPVIRQARSIRDLEDKYKYLTTGGF